MQHLNTTRHRSVFDATQFQGLPIHIIGCGATGSRIGLSLIELGLRNLHFYDFDIVESHNLCNQVFTSADIGSSKIEAMKRVYCEKTGNTEAPDIMTFNPIKVCKEPEIDIDLTGIVFLLVDTMAARREIWEEFISGKDTIPLVIETRMASSYGDINLINPLDPDQESTWLDSLIDDDAAEVSPCGASISVGPTANIIANMAVWQFMHFLTNPEAMDIHTTIHLKPLMLSTGESYV